MIGDMRIVGKLHIYRGSLILETNGTTHDGNFTYSIESSLKFRGSHVFRSSSFVQGGSNLTLTFGNFRFEGYFTGITGYTHGANTTVVFSKNYVFDYPMVIDNGFIEFIGSNSTFKKGLTLSV